MRACGQALLLASLVAACAAGRGLRAQTTENSKGEISGTVFDAETLQPLKNASVMLEHVKARPGGAPTMRMVVVGRPSFSPVVPSTATDAAGKFVFHDLDAGQYRVHVWHNGYVAVGYGEGGGSDPPRKVTLESGEKVNDLKIGLTPGGVVTGRITDEDGEPIPWVNVLLLMVDYSSEGVKQVFPVGSGASNDLGQYRVFGVPPGQYYVEADYPSGEYDSAGGGSGPATAYPEQLLYPGVTGPTNALEITVAAGQETTGIDFWLRRSPVYTVSGEVTAASASPDAGSASAVATSPQDDGQEDVQLISQGGGMFRPGSFYAQANGGRFEFKNVPAGSYTLLARKNGSRAGGHAVGLLSVSVSTNVSGLNVTLQPGFELSGRLSVEGQAGNSSRPYAVVLEPTTREMRGEGPTPGFVGKDGNFILKGVFPGSYWPRVVSMPPNGYFKSIRLGQQNGLAKPLDIPQGGTQESLTVAIGLNGARVAGAVVNGNDKPASDATVVLVPDAPLRGASSLYKVTATDQNGNFALSEIRPGSYELFAWENVEQNEWFDPAFLKAAESSATAVDLTGGQAARVTVHEIQAGRSGTP